MATTRNICVGQSAASQMRPSFASQLDGHASEIDRIVFVGEHDSFHLEEISAIGGAVQVDATQLPVRSGTPGRPGA